eukprot:gene13581-biopygen2005
MTGVPLLNTQHRPAPADICHSLPGCRSAGQELASASEIMTLVDSTFLQTTEGRTNEAFSGPAIKKFCRWRDEGNAPYTMERYVVPHVGGIGQTPPRDWGGTADRPVSPAPRDGGRRGIRDWWGFGFGASVGRRRAGGWRRGGGSVFSVRFLVRLFVFLRSSSKFISVEPRALGVSRYYGWDRGVA